MTEPLLDNGAISELLACAAVDQEPASQRQRALRRAARAALQWDVEAADLVAGGSPLTQLAHVGPWIAGLITELLAHAEPPPLPPPLRTGFLSRAAALRVMADAPEWQGAVLCDLQMHTLSSDGHATLETMARRCLELGYTHMAVTDHSEGLPIAHGMNAATRSRQAVEVAELNAKLAAEGADFTVLHGLEMNVSPEGEGDTDTAVLAGLDLVLGAFHSKLRLTDDQTDRYVSALSNPTVDVFAHPRCRMYDRRLGLSANWELVFEAAAELGVAMEVDAYPDRQDLDVDLLRLAAKYDTWIAVDTDSHHPVDLDAMPLGIATLVLGGVRRDRVINTLPAAELREWVAARRARAAARVGAGRVAL